MKKRYLKIRVFIYMITFTASFDKGKSRNAEKCCRNADFYIKIKATQAG